MVNLYILKKQIKKQAQKQTARISRNFDLAIALYFLVGLSFALMGAFWTGDNPVDPLQKTFSSGPMLTAIPAQAPHVYTVSPDVLAIDISAPPVKRGQQAPYIPHKSDVSIDEDSYTRIERGGRLFGTLLDGSSTNEPLGAAFQDDDNPLIYTYDQISETTLNLAGADSAVSYLIGSSEDADYATPVSPSRVFRKTKPVGFAHQSDGFHWPVAHTLFLSLPHPLTPGQTYHLSFPGLGLAETTFDYQPAIARSEAVHISQLGFRPDDPLKVGYLSTWMGNGGGLDYPDELRFTLIDERTNRPVYRSSASQVYERDQPEDPLDRDYTLSEVHQLDFSDFKRPGDYRLCVEGIGCSFSFEIANDVWRSAFFTAARGFYHQRSGIAIGEPYTAFERPRAFHPDDGVKVYQSGATLLETDMGLGDRDTFDALNSQLTQVIVPNAWGGYFDAGDWDRRIQHLAIPRGLLELHNLFPAHFKTVDLNLPESANQLPDILDEALWSLDFFRRLQTPEGGIRGGIQSAAEGTRHGEASWQESMTVMAFAPDVWSSYLYAGVAARAAYTLQAYDPALADVYQQSALKAIAYAEKHYREGSYTGELQHNVKDQRNLSALELYRLTGDSQWHDLFLATTIFHDAAAEVSVYGVQEQRDAAFLYARLNDTRSPSKAPLAVDETIQVNARAAFLRYADDLVQLSETTAFGWSKEHPYAPLGWGNGLGAPKSVNILQAHALTQDPDYLLAGINSTQFSAGANPDNQVYTTGLGERSPQHPLIVDQRITGQAPPPGITIYGPADLSVYRDNWAVQAIAPDMFPAPWEWPTVESGFDIYLYPIGSEFTVDYMLSSAYTWGYLAARE
ncbi:MAG: glycoside hydrolase family 9 protein [Phormidesmis sp.]